MSSNLKAPIRALLVLIFCFVSVLASAQVTTGDIVGTVTDQSGAVVVGATVTATNVGTQIKRSSKTSPNGEYVLNLLQPGQYTLTVEGPTFKKAVISNITLAVGDRNRINAVLALGQHAETVEVQADAAPSLQTESAAIQSEIPESSVQDVPLNGRNFINLVQMAPGVSAGNPKAISGGGKPDDQRQASTVQANGQSDQLNNQLVDGLDNNERQQGLIGIRPSIDAIAEMKVQTNNYTADMGRTAGAVVNVMTKSGTNQFHGSAFEFLRNDITDARDFFAKKGLVNKPEMRQNQFGGSVGGPIIKNKTFFFAAIEWLRQVNAPNTWTNTVPTDYERAHPGDFSDIHGAYNAVVPAGNISPVALNYLKLYPAANAPGFVDPATGVTTNNFVYAPKKTQFGKTFDVRLDHHFNENNSFFVHYAYNPVSTVTPTELPAAQAFGKTVYSGGAPSFTGVFDNIGGPSSTTAQAIGLDYVHIFTPRLLLNLKAGYNRIHIQSLPFNYGSNLASQFGVQNANISADSSGLPTMLFFSGPYASLGDGFFVPIDDANNVYQINGSINYTRGAHSIKAGGAYIYRQLFYFQDTMSPQGGYLFFPYVGPYANPLANFTAGVASAWQRGNDLVHPKYLQKEPSLFIQDDWRVSNTLTVNVGLRYEIFTPMTEGHNYYSNFNPTTAAVDVAGKGTTSAIGVKTQYNNISPRIGMSWSFAKNTVLRSGFGMSYFPVDYQGAVQNINPPYNYTCFPCGFGNAQFPILPLPDSSLTAPSGTLSYRPSNFGPGHLFQYNLALQRQIGNNAITVAYVGSLGHDLMWISDYNRPLPPGAGVAAQPAFIYAAQLPGVSNINWYTNKAHNNFNAMQLIFDRHIGGGLTVNANYTWSHGLGNAADASSTTDAGLLPNNPGYDYGATELDVRQRFSIMATYKLPFGKTLNGPVAILAKGWQANLVAHWQTGLPITVEDGASAINIPGIRSDRPNMSHNPNRSNGSIAQWFDTSAFSTQTIGTPGSEPVNAVYGPHDRRVDVSMFKSFALIEATKLEFRAECYNISNTPSFDRPNINLGDPGFGSITKTIQNPRQFQFALKLTF